MPAHVIDSVFFRDLFGSEALRAVFDDMTLLQKWLDFEAALARAEARLSLIPAGSPKKSPGFRAKVKEVSDDLSTGVQPHDS